MQATEFLNFASELVGDHLFLAAEARDHSFEAFAGAYAGRELAAELLVLVRQGGGGGSWFGAAWREGVGRGAAAGEVGADQFDAGEDVFEGAEDGDGEAEGFRTVFFFGGGAVFEYMEEFKDSFYVGDDT